LQFVGCKFNGEGSEHEVRRILGISLQGIGDGLQNSTDAA